MQSILAGDVGYWKLEQHPKYLLLVGIISTQRHKRKGGKETRSKLKRAFCCKTAENWPLQ